MHARENLTGRPYQFAGPHTSLDLRLGRNDRPKHWPKHINHIDEAAMRHDIAYRDIENDYKSNPTPENKKRQIDKVWNDADEAFITTVKRYKDEDPKVALACENLIKLKRKGEQLGVLPTKTFSGFGLKLINKLKELDEEDPAYKLKVRGLIEQHGGAIPALLIPVLASVVGSIASSIFNKITDKISGKGLNKIKTDEQKKIFLMKLCL